jgi:hypothetical protein
MCKNIFLKKSENPRFDGEKNLFFGTLPFSLGAMLAK